MLGVLQATSAGALREGSARGGQTAASAKCILHSQRHLLTALSTYRTSPGGELHLADTVLPTREELVLVKVINPLSSLHPRSATAAGSM